MRTNNPPQPTCPLCGGSDFADGRLVSNRIGISPERAAAPHVGHWPAMPGVRIPVCLCRPTRVAG